MKTNEEKAKEIAIEKSRVWNDQNYGLISTEGDCYNSAMEMAKWKDNQFFYVVTRSEEHSDYVEKLFFDKQKAIDYCTSFENKEYEYVRNYTEIKLTT